MTARELGQKLVELARKDDYPTIYSELYSPTVVSTEADGKTYTGMAEIEAKNEWWSSTMEVHSTECSDAFPHGDSFAIIWKMDLTEKASGHRFVMEEVAVYDVADGRIVKERFFYTMG
jgi:ketosteroid isomerase-like protein